MNDLVPVLLVFREEDFEGNSYHHVTDCAISRATKRHFADLNTSLLVGGAGGPMFIGEYNLRVPPDTKQIHRKFDNPESPLPDPILIYLPKKYLKEAPAEKSYEEKTERMTK